MSRILVVSYGVIPSPTRHGVELDNLLKALCGRYEVDVMTVRAAELPFVQKYRRAKMLRVPAGEGPPDATQDLAAPEEWVQPFRRAVNRQLQGADYDLIIVRDRHAAQAVREAEFVEGTVVYEVDRLSARGPAASEEERCLERADLIIARSETLKAEIERRHPRAAIHLVEVGVDIDRFDWERLPMPRVPRLVFHGSVAPGSGLTILVDALPRILEHHHVVAWFVGGGPPRYRAELADRAKKLGVRKRIEMFGPIEHADLARLLAMTTLGVVPAIRGLGPCPNQVLEHAACRKAVVAARHPEVRRLFDTKAELVTFNPGDASDLARVVRELLDDEQRCRRLADRAYRRVRDRYAASASRRTVLSAFLGLAPPFGLPRGMRKTSAQLEASAMASVPSEGTDMLPTIPNLPGLPEASRPAVPARRKV